MENSSFQFHGYRVTEFVFTATNDFGSGEEKFSQNVEVKPRVDKDNKLLVEVVLSISIATESENLGCNVSITGLFERSEDMPDDNFERMFKHNAPAVLYPFVRALVSSVTSQAGMPPIILPLLPPLEISWDLKPSVLCGGTKTGLTTQHCLIANPREWCFKPSAGRTTVRKMRSSSLPN